MTAVTDISQRSNLTRLQLLYWVSQKLRPATPLFSAALALALPGGVDVARFQRAVARLAAESDALRGVIVEEDGVPQWRVRPSLPNGFIHLDFAHLPDPETAAQKWMQAEAARPFVLDEQLFRTALIEIGPDEAVWFLHQHHLITDAASNFLIFDLVQKMYAGETAVSPETAVIHPFAAYQKYEKSYRQSEQYQTAAAYWQDKLAADIEPLRFGGRLPRRQNTYTHRLTHDIDPARAHQLKEMIRQRRELFSITPYLSLYNVLAALTFVLIHRLTAQRPRDGDRPSGRRLSFLSPVQNRVTLPFRETIGLLMQLCPFFIEIEEADTFLSLAQKMQRETKATMRHYQYGTGLAVQNKVHPVMFNYHRRPALTWHGRPVAQQLIHAGHGGDVLAVHVHDFDETGVLRLMVDLHDDAFLPEQRQPVIAALAALLDAFLHDPEQVVADVELDLPETAVVPLPDRPPQVEPRDMLEFQLRQMWQALLGVPEIGVRDDFFDLGGSSLQAMRLVSQVEALTGRYVPMSLLLEAPTIAQLAALLRERTAASWQKIVTIQAGNGGRRPLFLIPGAGGNGLAIARIARHLHPNQPVKTFLLPGLVDVQVTWVSVPEIAAFYREALLTAQPDGPYLLGGYSAGGVVAFELAQQLAADGRQVGFLAVIDAPAQGAGYAYLRRMTRRWGRWFGYSDEREQALFLRWRDALFRADYWLRRGLGEAAAFQARRLVRLAQGERLAGNGRLRPAADELGERLEDERMRAVFAASDRAVRCYIPQPYAGRVTLLRSEGGYGRAEVRSPHADLGWGKVARQVEVVQIPGNHVEMVQEPQVAVLGRQLQSLLDLRMGR